MERDMLFDIEELVVEGEVISQHYVDRGVSWRKIYFSSCKR